MRLAIVVLLCGMLVFLGVHLWSFSARSAAAEVSIAELRLKLERAETDRQTLESDAAYFGNPTNLEKELRARFHYRAPGETMIVIVPKQQAATSVSR